MLSLFRSLDSTDFFEKTYLRNLARRLLSKEGYDLEQEKKMVATLKPECGENFQSQTELMFTSTTESEAFTEAFLATTPASKLPFTNFTIKVIIKVLCKVAIKFMLSQTFEISQTDL